MKTRDQHALLAVRIAYGKRVHDATGDHLRHGTRHEHANDDAKSHAAASWMRYAEGYNTSSSSNEAIYSLRQAPDHRLWAFRLRRRGCRGNDVLKQRER